MTRTERQNLGGNKWMAGGHLGTLEWVTGFW